MAQRFGDDTLVYINALEKTIRNNLAGVRDSLLSDRTCIFRVPEVLRRNNTKAYQPDMVAIGPLHNREQEQYQHMEQVKRWYLREYILSSKQVDLAKLIEDVAKHETLTRDCYAESLDSINPNDFIEMMILDGCFIVELFRKFNYKKRSDSSQHKEDDPSLPGCFIVELFRKFNCKEDDSSQPKEVDRSQHKEVDPDQHKEVDPDQPKEYDPILSMDCMIQYIFHDLLLLENQLPWDVLHNLYRLTRVAESEIPLSKLILQVFEFVPSVGDNCKVYQNHLSHSDDDDAKHKHLLDFVRTAIVHSFRAPKTSGKGETRCLQSAKENKIAIGKEIPSATTLSKGGVKFNGVSQNGKISIMHMEFEGGVLTIPQLAIEELTEPLFRNLIAFEQCYKDRSHKITSYAALMDKLITSKEDMEFLCEKKIIQNWLSAEDGLEFFNKLYNDTLLENFYYSGLCTRVNRYYNVECVRWMEIFRRKYFHTPWTVISLLAATLLLVLTLLQTIFTVHD